MSFAAIASIASPLAAQDAAPAASPEKAAIELETAKEALAKAQQDRLLAAIAAVKPAAEGKAEVKTAADSAEALILWRAALADAAQHLTEDEVLLGFKKTPSSDSVALQTTSSPPSSAPGDLNPIGPAPDPLACPAPGRANAVLVMGAVAPDVSQWLAFRATMTLLAEEFSQVAKAWNDADQSGTGSHPLIGPLPAVTLATTILPLFKTDFIVEGTKITPGDQEVRAAIGRVLKLDDPDLVIAEGPDDVANALKGLEQTRLNAQVRIKAYEKKFPADAKPPPSEQQKAAYEAMKALVDQYDAMKKALYTPAGGVLPAVTIERQRLRWCDRKRLPILYILGVKAALTSVTKKNLFTGLGSKPATLRLALAIDYATAIGADVRYGKVEGTTAAIAFDKVGDGGMQAIALPR